MSKVKLLSLLAAVLFLINLVLIGFLFLKPGKHGPGEGPKKLIIERLNLNREQVVQYEALIREHRKSIHQADRELREAKNQLYQTLSHHATDSLQQLMLEKTAKIHQHIEEIHYRHFQDIRALCSPEQLPAFDSLRRDLSKLFSGPPHPRPRP